MKKLTIILISAIILLSISAITIFALTSDADVPSIDDTPTIENVQIVKPSAFETLSSVITDNGTFALAKFNQKEIFADISRDNMRDIYNTFDVVLEKNDIIEIKDTMYHRYLLNCEKIKFTLTNDVDLEYIYCYQENGEEIALSHEGKIIIPTDQSHDVLKYVMFTSVYMELFPDNWTYGFTQQQIYELNSEWLPQVHVFPDYAEYGFTSAFDAFQSTYNIGCKRTEKYFWFSLDAIVNDNSKSFIRQINEFMKDSEDSYALECFFFELERAAKFVSYGPLPKKTEAVK